MILKAIKATAIALLFYIVYYACQFIMLFVIPADSVIATVMGSLLFAAVSLLILSRLGRSPVSYVGITVPSAADTAYMLLFGAALNIICTVVMAFIPFPESMVEQYAEASAQLSEPHIIWTALLTLLIAPCVEELLFRGLIYKSLRHGFNAPIAAVMSSLLFGFAHNTPIWIIYAAFFGCVLAFVYEKFKSLTASALFHFGFNLVGFLVSEVSIPAIMILALFPVPVLFSAITLVRIFKMNKKEKQSANLQNSLDL